MARQQLKAGDATVRKKARPGARTNQTNGRARENQPSSSSPQTQWTQPGQNNISRWGTQVAANNPLPYAEAISMARKAKKKEEVSPPPAAVDDDVTEPESVQEDDGDVQMNSADDDIPEIVNKESGDDNGDCDAAAEGSNKCTNDVDQNTKKKDKKTRSEMQMQQATTATTEKKAPIPFMDTFFQLSSEESPNEILKEDAYSNQLMEDSTKEDASYSADMIVRHKLLACTQFIAVDANSKSNDKGRKKNQYGGKMKEAEKRDHSFGRLFGILAVIRSGILGLNDFPLEVSPAIPDLSYVQHSQC